MASFIFIKNPDEEAFRWLVAAYRLSWLENLSFGHDAEGAQWARATAAENFRDAPHDLKRQWDAAGGD